MQALGYNLCPYHHCAPLPLYSHSAVTVVTTIRAMPVLRAEIYAEIRLRTVEAKRIFSSINPSCVSADITVMVKSSSLSSIG